MSGGTISWGTPVQITTDSIYLPTIAIDTNGYPWVAGEDQSHSNYLYYSKATATSGATWGTWTAINSNTVYGSDQLYTLPGGDLLLTDQTSATTIISYLYTTSWSSSTTVISDLVDTNSLSGSIYGSTVLLSYVGTGNVSEDGHLYAWDRMVRGDDDRQRRVLFFGIEGHGVPRSQHREQLCGHMGEHPIDRLHLLGLVCERGLDAQGRDPIQRYRSYRRSRERPNKLRISGSYYVQFMFADAGNNIYSLTQQFGGVPFPTFTNAPSTTTVQCYHSWSWQATCSETITSWSLSGNASWLTCSNGLVSGTPSFSYKASFYETLTATNSYGSCQYSWWEYVTWGNGWAPSFTNSPNLQASPQHSWSFTPTLKETGTFVYLQGPSWASWNSATSTVSGTCSQLGSWTLTIQATSTKGLLSTTSTWTISSTGWQPTVTSSPSLNLKPTVAWSWAVTANETCTYSPVSTPTRASWNSATDTFSGTCNSLGSWVCSVTVTSSRGLGSTTVQYTLVCSGWSAIWTSSPSLSGSHGVQYSYQPTTNQSANIVILTLPAWASWTSGKIVGTPNAPGSFPCSIACQDLLGLKWNYQNFSISVSTWAYSFSNSPSLNGVHGTLYMYYPSCSGPVAYTTLTLPSFLQFSGTELYGYPNAPGSFAVSIQCQATDGLGHNWMNFSILRLDLVLFVHIDRS